MAQTPDYSRAYGSAVSNALMIAQTRKTNAEATIVEDHQNQAKLESAPAPVGAPAPREDKIGFKPAFLRSETSRVWAVLDICVCQARCSRALASEDLADFLAP
jgi:hypothetical protein